MAGNDPLPSSAPNTWPEMLRASLTSRDEKPWGRYGYAIGGTTVDSWNGFYLPQALSDLAAHIHEAPDVGSVAFINLGVNDLGFAAAQSGPMPLNQTLWQNRYLAILDALHDQYPTVHFYVTKPWKRGFDGWCDILAGWVDNVVAARTFLSVGDDERVWMKGSDNGATQTDDGIHPNATGQVTGHDAKLAVLP